VSRGEGSTGRGKPVPTALKKLRGNPGRRPLNENEPEAPVSEKVPQCPPYLQGEARKEWFRIAPMLHETGLLTKLDVRMLASYCVDFATWIDATNEIQRSGSVIMGGKDKDIPMLSPFVRVAREAEQACHRKLIEFGLSPSSRTRVKVSKPEAKDPFELFLLRGNKKA
jgi:P27 family predicted phage terminase small subunit